MKITISDFYGQEYSVTLDDGSDGNAVKEAFDRLLIQLGFSTDIRCADGGHYELTYKEDD